MLGRKDYAREELAYLPATEALDAFARRSLSPVELMEATIARADAVEPIVNAFAHRFFEQALEEARVAEARYMGIGDAPRRLEGLPVAIKEETPIAGRPWTQGSVIYRDLVADFTAPVPERVLAAGGIVHAIAAAPEFSCAPWTNTHLNGVTRNPWNTELSPGGSSGGSSATLASGTSALATGSDIGGSNRIPAGFCGVVGYKPPYGRVPSYPPFNLDYYNHEGPQGRTVRDCLLLYDTIAGPHPVDPATVPLPRSTPSLTGDVAGLRVAVAPTLGGFLVDDASAANTLAAAEILRGAGAVVEEVDLAWAVADIEFAALEHFKSLFAPFIAAAARDHRDVMCRYSLDWLTIAGGPLDLVAAMEMEGRLWEHLGRLFARYRLLLCPTNGVAGFPAEQWSLLDLPAVGGVKPSGLFTVLPTVVFNMFSRCPAMSVPSGFAANGLPTGVQLVGGPFDEEPVFNAALAIESARPCMDGPERRPNLV